MVSSLELRRIAAFSNLSDDQISWFLGHAQEVSVQAGEAFVRRASQRTGCSFSWMDFSNGEENSAAALCHFQRKPAMLVGCFLSPG